MNRDEIKIDDLVSCPPRRNRGGRFPARVERIGRCWVYVYRKATGKVYRYRFEQIRPWCTGAVKITKTPESETTH
jgi:hypothetical protein